MKVRKPNRLKDYDYSLAGAYFVTLLTKNRVNYFGEIVNGEMKLTQFGKIAEEMWLGIEKIHKNITLGEFVVMPNHIHGIIIINNDIVRDAYSRIQNKNSNPNIPVDEDRDLGAADMRPLQNPLQNNNILDDRSKMMLSKVIQLYKSAVMKQIKRKSTKPNSSIPSIWQRSFYDHIIRDQKSYDNIWKYIHYNPVKWEWDVENRSNKNQDKNYYNKLYK